MKGEDAMWRKIDGIKYLMRDKRKTKELRINFNKILEKYPNTKLTFMKWLVKHGKIYTSK